MHRYSIRGAEVPLAVEVAVRRHFQKTIDANTALLGESPYNLRWDERAARWVFRHYGADIAIEPTGRTHP